MHSYIHKFTKEHLTVEKRSPQTTIDSYELRLSLLQSCLKKPLHTATRQEIVDIFASKRANWQPSTQNAYLTALLSFFNYLVENKLLDINPVEGIHFAATPVNQDVRILTQAELTELLVNPCGEDDYSRERNRMILYVFVDTGIRLSELSNLKKEDIDGQTITIQKGKGNKFRRVFIRQSTTALLQDYIRLFAQDGAFVGSEYLFTGRSGNNLSGRYIQKIVQETTQQLNINGVHPHTFRHTFATNYLKLGGSEITLMELMGWTSIERVQIYRHYDDTARRDEYNRIMEA